MYIYLYIHTYICGRNVMKFRICFKLVGKMGGSINETMLTVTLIGWWIPGSSAGKESACNVGDLGSIPGLGRSPGEGNGYPLQYSGLENSMDCIVQGITNSWPRLSDFHTYLEVSNDALKITPCSGLKHVFCSQICNWSSDWWRQLKDLPLSVY